MSTFKARSPDDLTILRAGMCPDCGATVSRATPKCVACGLSFENNLGDLPAPKGAAPAPAPQAPPSAPTVTASRAYPPPSPQGYAPPPQGYPPQAHAPPPAGARPAASPAATPESPATWGKPLTPDDIDLLERGALKANVMPLTDAEAPDVTNGSPSPLLGSSLSRAAIVVMAEAAVCDDPLVLLGYPVTQSHVARAMINLRRGEAPIIDDPEVLIAARDNPSPQAVPKKRGPSADFVEPVHDGPRQAPQGGIFTGPGVGKPITNEEMERLERPFELEQPHSYAEVCDLEGGVGDPKLGQALIRGATAAMADAAVVDDPLVLLGYPVVVPKDVARMMINLKRTEAATTDEVESLLKREQPKAAAPVAAAPAAAAPAAAVAAAPRRAPPMMGGGDPDATALIDQAAVRAAQAAVAREEHQQQQRNPNRVASRILSRGGAQSLDD